VISRRQASLLVATGALGYTVAAAADNLGLPAGAAYQTLHRAQAAMRTSADEDTPAPAGLRSRRRSQKNLLNSSPQPRLYQTGASRSEVPRTPGFLPDASPAGLATDPLLAPREQTP
jgi:hypothetical protein